MSMRSYHGSLITIAPWIHRAYSDKHICGEYEWEFIVWNERR